MSCLYVLKVKPLSVTLFAKIFCHSVGCLFILFLVGSGSSDVESKSLSLCFQEVLRGPSLGPFIHEIVLVMFLSLWGWGVSCHFES